MTPSSYEKATAHYSSLEWHKRKSEFIDLWIRKDLSLADVARRMRSASFQATERQWKRKAGEWGLRKYTRAGTRELEINRLGLSSEDFLKRGTTALEAATSKDRREIKRMRRFLQRRQRSARTLSRQGANEQQSPTICDTSDDNGGGKINSAHAKCPLCGIVFQENDSEQQCREHIASIHDHQLLRCALTKFRGFCGPSGNGVRIALPVDPAFPIQFYDDFSAAAIGVSPGSVLRLARIAAYSIPTQALRGDPLSRLQRATDHSNCLRSVEIETKIFDALLVSGKQLASHARQLRELFQGETESVGKLRERYESLERDFFRDQNTDFLSLRATVRAAVREAICVGSRE